MGGRVAGLHVRTATPLSAGEGGRASGVGESEAGRIVTGPTCIMRGLAHKGVDV